MCRYPRQFSFLCSFNAVLSLLASIAVLAVMDAQALTLDDFSGTGEVQVSGASNPVQAFNAFSSNGALGGTRALRLQRTAGTLSAVLETTPDAVLALSQGPAVSATSSVTWDGDLIANNLNGSGLGGIDLQQDGSTAFRLNILGFDFPGSQPITITLVVYDAIDGTGATFSSRSVTIDHEISVPETVELPFSSFTISGPGGAANFTRVGAMQLIIDGTSTPAADLVIDSLTTNGTCPLVPIGGPVVDICGVCGGNGQSCLDCAGVPFGGKVLDQCNVCGGDGTSCLDCANVPFGTSVVDQCGVCGGDGTSCLDCQGTPNGSAVLDQCGVCGGDGTSCLDCSGAPNGGKVIDQCNVCGGDGTSCIDCKGTPFGTVTVDRCGICGGDGTSCLGCTDIDQGDILHNMDNGAKLQESTIRQAAARLVKLDTRARTRSYVRKTLRKAHDLQIRNWTISWFNKQIVTLCANSTFCTTVDTGSGPVLEEYRRNNTTLRDIAFEVLARLEALGNKATAKLRGRAEKQYAANEALSYRVQLTENQCS